ncbi:hypothetical protein AK812_SmicGene19773 [Symbiodinium microadriaticum]|uniref:Uncharacterized protein n=1 Tax=Symbiodinium microadriaticum TaxID=2951 RepID=A0A1Q9DRN7_SYMMI|nr:hypothetical protein AK812_SmicGene19773 [Symbiodinium microadriaticum]
MRRDTRPGSVRCCAYLAAMSLRMFTGWFQGAEAETAEAPMAGYAAPVKNTFIHYECDEQPDYRCILMRRGESSPVDPAAAGVQEMPAKARSP